MSTDKNMPTLPGGIHPIPIPPSMPYNQRPLGAIDGGSIIYRPVEMFTTLDSGERESYDSGMVRDTTQGKPDYTLIDYAYLKRWAELMVRGAEKYGRDNWRKANSREELERFEASALRHMFQWLEGDTSEDHAVAVAFNIAAAEFVRSKKFLDGRE